MRSIKEQQMDKPIKKENIKNIIAVSSGKGGVGKSFVTGLTAVSLSRKGYRVGILDADITGPSIPKMFGVTGGIRVDENMMIAPAVSSTGIKVMSVNFFLENEDTPVLWRGPILSNFIRQFWDQTTWGDLDYLVIDMPPGTGDVPLTVYQTVPVDGVVIVTSPQDLVRMIVKKSVHMAEKMEIPVFGIVENYSYMPCPDCGKKLYPFGQSKVDAIAQELKLKVLGKLPICPAWAELADNGDFESVPLEELQ